MSSFSIARVTESDLDELLPLVAAYCAFYEQTEQIPPAAPEALRALSLALLADPEREGVQLLARDADGGPIGFATIYWTWDTLGAARNAVMYDLFVTPDARGSGLADGLIAACRDAAREHGAAALSWTTAPGNARAQAVYDRVGGERSTWVHYDLTV